MKTITFVEYDEDARRRILYLVLRLSVMYFMPQAYSKFVIYSPLNKTNRVYFIRHVPVFCLSYNDEPRSVRIRLRGPQRNVLQHSDRSEDLLL